MKTKKKNIILNKLQNYTLLNQPYVYNMNITVEDHIKSYIAMFGENIQIGKVCKFKIGD